MATRTYVVELINSGRKRPFQLFDGISPKELISLVKAAFGVVPIGFETHYNFVVPPEVLCAFTHLYDKQELQVLTDPASASASEGKGSTVIDEKLVDGKLGKIYNFTQMIDLERLHMTVMKTCGPGGLDRDEFQAAMTSLLPSGTPDGIAAPYLASLSAMFDLFDTNDDGVVDRNELLSGLSLLCAGSVEERLQVVFALVDEAGNGYISPKQMFSFVRTSLLVSLSLSHHSANRSKQSLASMASDMAEEATEAIFADADLSRNNQISFPEFTEYCKLNPALFSWINIYSKLSVNNDSKSGVNNDSKSDVTPPAAVPQTPGLRYAAPTPKRGVITLSTEKGDSIEVNPVSLSAFKEEMGAGLSSVQAISDDLVDVFQSETNSGRVNRSEFNSLMRRLLFSDNKDNAGKVDYHIDKLFDMFDVAGSGIVDTGEFVTGMLIFSKGSRTAKLQLAFGMFDTDKNGFISRDEMFRFIDSFLRVCVSFSGNTRGEARFGEVVNTLASEATEEFFRLADTNNDQKVSWEEFLAYYNTYGRQVKWLSLLNEMIPEEEGDDEDEKRAPPPQSHRPDEKSSGPLSKVVLTIPLAEGGSLCIREDDVTKFRFLRTIFSKVTPRMYQVFSQRRFLDEENFLGLMAEVIPSGSLSPNLQGIVAQNVKKLFQAFDYNNDGIVDVDEFLRGMALLGATNKKQTLELIFELIDRDSNGEISMEEMCEFFASFLLLICAICDDALCIPSAYLKQIVFQAAHGTTESFFAITDRNRDGAISWDEFIYMYKNNRQLVPWLQLLDIAQIQDSKDEEKQDEIASEERDEGDNMISSQPVDYETSVVLLTTDIKALTRLAPVFAGIPPERILTVFRREAIRGYLDRNTFSEVMADLFYEALAVDEGLSKLFRNLFNLFDHDQRSRVSAKDFLTALWIMCSPSITEKLKLVFMFSDTDADEGLISPYEVNRFMICLLRVSFGVRDLNTEKCAVLRNSIMSEAKDITDALFQSVKTNDDGLISFDQFATAFVRHPFSKVLEVFDATPPMAKHSNGTVASAPEEEVDFDGAEGEGLVLEMKGGVDIQLKAEDIKGLEFLVDSLGGVTFTQLMNTFVNHATDGVLERKHFKTAIDSVISPAGLSASEQWLLGFLLHRLFEVFDQNGDGKVDCFEFLSGVNFLLSSDLKQKLAVGFMMVDSNSDGHIDFNELQRFLTSFFSLLGGVSSEARALEYSTLRQLIESEATRAATVLFNLADVNRNGKISLKEFESAYLSAPELLPWVNLFVRLTSEPSRVSDSDEEKDNDGDENIDYGDEDEDEEDQDEEEDQRDAREEYAEDIKVGPLSSLAYVESNMANMDENEGEDTVLSLQVSNEGHELTLTSDDIAKLNFFKSALQTMDFKELLSVFSSDAEGKKGEMDRNNFVNVLEGLMPADSLSEDEYEHLREHLQTLFAIVDRDADGVVSTHEFLCGLYVFCEEPPAKKLSVLFAMIDTDQDGILSHEEIWQFYYAVSSALVGLSSWAHNVPTPHLIQLISNAASIKTEAFIEVAQSKNGEVSFEEFCRVLVSAPSASFWVNVPSSEETTDDQDNQNSLVLSTKDLETLRHLSKSSQFSGLDLKAMLKAFSDVAVAADHGSTIDREGFSKIIDKLLPGVTELSPEDRKAFTDVLFLTLDRDHNKVVDVTELTAGLAVFLKGNMLQKLKLAFDLCDADNNDFVSKPELFKVLVATLSVIVASSTDARNLPPEQLRVMAGKLAHKATLEIFKRGDLNNDGQLSFSEFAQLHESDPTLLPWMGIYLTQPPSQPPTPSAPPKEEKKGPARLVDGSNAKQLKYMRNVSGLGTRRPETVYKALKELSVDKCVERDAFIAFIADISKLDTLPREMQMHVISFFGMLFDSIDYANLKRVPTPELAFILCGFCHADSASKLRIAFDMFDEDEDGYISKLEMFYYMRTLVAFVLTSTAREGKEAKDLVKVCNHLAQQTIDRIFEAADANHDGKLSFSEFTDLCENHKDLCPWIAVFQVFDDDKQGSSRVEAKSSFHPKNVLANLKRTQAALAGVSPKLVFEACMQSKGEWDLEEFKKLITKLTKLQGPELASISSEMSILFDTFDQHKDGKVDVCELMSGLFFLTEGTAQEKLDFAFKIFDQDGDGCISRVELFTLLVAFVKVLMLYSLSEDISKKPSKNQAKKAEEIAYVQARKAVDAVFANAKKGPHDTLSHAEFHSHGIKSAPWLGMLGLFAEADVEHV